VADSITLKYQDNSSGVIYTETFSPLRVKGFDPIDSLEDYPDMLHEIVDGSLIHQTVGIRRSFTIELGVVQVAKRLFVGNFWRSTAKWLIYTHDDIEETIQVVRNEAILQTEWKDDTVLARYIVLYLKDKFILDEFPETRNFPIPEDGMYFKRKVLITGNSETPESFTTGSGKLATCDAPAGAWPYFDLTVQKYFIVVNGRVYQDCFFFLAGDESTSGGNLTFTVSRSDAGNPYAGVSFYADIVIFAQDIV